MKHFKAAQSKTGKNSLEQARSYIGLLPSFHVGRGTDCR